MLASFNIWQMLGWILISALLWMYYVQLKDLHQPEPRRRLLFAFILGMVACGLAMLGFILVEAAGFPDVKFNEGPWTAVFCFVFVGPIEEGSKVLLAYLFVFRWREFDEPMDGFVYAAAIALGFATVENLFHVSGLDWQQQLARTVTLPITHTLFSSIWGFGIAYARLCLPRSTRRTLWQVGSIALGMSLHGLYDFLLLAYQATLVTSGMALAIWVFVIWRAHVLAKQAGALRTNSTPTEQPAPRNP